MTQPVLSEELATAGTEAAVRARSSLALAVARLRRDKVAVVSLVVVVLIVLTAVFAPVVAAITGHDPNFQYRDDGLSPDGLPVGPNGEFWLGTDRLGRDVLVRLAYGARVSLVVGLLASACAVAIGVLVGTVSGYLRGRTDLVLNWVIDLILSIPFLLFAISLVSLVGPSLKISVLVIACFTWGPIARVVRGQVLSIREREFIEAARSLGGTRRRIIVRDVLPNLVAPIIVYATLLIPSAIVFEATLSFLGLSVTPPTATWGNMLAEASQNALYTVAWWIVVFPSLALLATTLAFNLLGDGLRDALDPGASRRPGRLARTVRRGRKRAERARAAAAARDGEAH
ncbi:ABC transporter permease [Nocardioides anomalus]|uniref:ABC transporter permease n=1 Tax=Nocardioides anomalus TaxID=2712223 RepID=A0A6G6W9I0_9ACTN|nr:ABC transporter permease [Nocardioides anomalus]QIG41998.1 ABC transporter permease [Nocardioides anomalus]